MVHVSTEVENPQVVLNFPPFGVLLQLQNLSAYVAVPCGGDIDTYSAQDYVVDARLIARLGFGTHTRLSGTRVIRMGHDELLMHVMQVSVKLSGR